MGGQWEVGLINGRSMGGGVNSSNTPTYRQCVKFVCSHPGS